MAIFYHKCVPPKWSTLKKHTCGEPVVNERLILLCIKSLYARVQWRTTNAIPFNLHWAFGTHLFRYTTGDSMRDKYFMGLNYSFTKNCSSQMVFLEHACGVPVVNKRLILLHGKPLVSRVHWRINKFNLYWAFGTHLFC